jgi:hypothetical protein
VNTPTGFFASLLRRREAGYRKASDSDRTSLFDCSVAFEVALPFCQCATVPLVLSLGRLPGKRSVYIPICHPPAYLFSPAILAVMACISWNRCGTDHPGLAVVIRGRWSQHVSGMAHASLVGVCGDAAAAAGVMQVHARRFALGDDRNRLERPLIVMCDERRREVLPAASAPQRAMRDGFYQEVS